jgi:hypothetical protein
LGTQQRKWPGLGNREVSTWAWEPSKKSDLGLGTLK